jgi:hypothetical protein
VTFRTSALCALGFTFALGGCGGAGSSTAPTTDGTTGTIVATEADTQSTGGGEQWSGRVSYAGTFDHDTRLGAAKCTTRWEGTLRFAVAGDSSLDGNGDAHQVNVHCQFRQLPDPHPAVTFTISGERQSDVLHLHVVFADYGGTKHDYGGFAVAFFHGALGHSGYTYALKVAGSTAHDSFPVDIDYANGVQHAKGTVELQLRCAC